MRLLLFELVSWFARLLPGPAGRGFDSSLVRGRASQDATCIKQLAQSAEQVAQSNLRRPTCTELAQSNLQGATCTEQFAQSNLQGATCRDQLVRSNLRGATCAECNLRRATCADQLAPTSLRRAPCLVLSRACFTNASCREKERILQRWADLAVLSGQPWSSCSLGAENHSGALDCELGFTALLPAVGKSEAELSANLAGRNRYPVIRLLRVQKKGRSHILSIVPGHLPQFRTCSPDRPKTGDLRSSRNKSQVHEF